MASSVVFVGNLPNDVREGELADIFRRYGRVRLIDIKWPPNPPPFAFVEFEDARDAEDAVRGEDGKTFAGERMRVEIARGRGNGGDGPRRGGGGGYRVKVHNLPGGCSWQDVKDHFRAAGPAPAFVDVFGGSGGGDGKSAVVEFGSMDDARDVVRAMNGSEFRDRRGGDTTTIRVEMEGEEAGGGGGGRSPPRDGGRSPPRDARKGRERSRSPPAW